MPSHRIHEKYGKLMNLPLNVVREIDRFTDDPRWHDFFDSALQRKDTPDLRAIGGRIIIYSFDGSLLYAPSWKPFRASIEKYGDAGWKAFFLHIWLDLMERNMRGGKGFAILKLDDISGYFRKYIEEVENFLQERVEDVLNDIASYISERNSKRKFSRRLGEPEAPFLTKASSKAIAEKILREYSAELLTFGAGWVVENHRGELGIATEEPAVIELLMKSLKKFGKEMMRRATRGVEYLAAMLLHDQADRIVRGGIRAGMTCEWSDLRAIIMRDFTEALVKYGGKDLQLIIMGYAYKLLEASYAEMPEDIRRALRYFENEEKG